MPRGVPKAGFRVRKNKTQPKFIPTVHVETDEQIDAKLRVRFSILDHLTKATIKGVTRSLIVSGPPGLGKSFNVEALLSKFGQEERDYTIIRGYVKATGLYKAFYNYRDSGKVVVFDDSDSIFFDGNALNLLKAACDTIDNRVLSYRSEYVMYDEEGVNVLPRSFEFNASVIFITNLDFDDMIMKGNKLAPHLQALISRSHYVDLAMKTKRDYLIRIKQVVADGMLKVNGCTPEMENDVIFFIEKNIDNLRELSLRMALKIAHIRKIDANWHNIAKITCCKGG